MSAFGSKRNQADVIAAPPGEGIIGWEGKKPDDPVILWDDPILARCDPNNTRLCWFDNDTVTVPRELVTGTPNEYTYLDGPVLGFDTPPGGWGMFNNDFMQNAADNAVWLPGYTSFPSADGEFTLAAAFRMPSINQGIHAYCHMLSDMSMWTNGCNFALSLFVRANNTSDGFVNIYANRGEIIKCVDVSVGHASAPVVPIGDWVIVVARLSNTLGNRIRLKTFASVGVDLTVDNSNQVSWVAGSSPPSAGTFVGCVSSTVSTGRHWIDRMSLAYFLPTPLSNAELDYLVDNPYHFLQEA